MAQMYNSKSNNPVFEISSTNISLSPLHPKVNTEHAGFTLPRNFSSTFDLFGKIPRGIGGVVSEILSHVSVAYRAQNENTSFFLRDTRPSSIVVLFSARESFGDNRDYLSRALLLVYQRCLLFSSSLFSLHCFCGREENVSGTR